MPETILFAILLSKYKKYKVKPLFQHKEIYCILFIEVIYLAMQFMLFNKNYTVIKYASMLKTIYLCAYLGFVFRYELYLQAIIGSGCILLGSLCNRIAIIANGGKMPVFPNISYLTGYTEPKAFQVANQVANDFHILGGQETKLKLLTDIFDIGYSILSVGDLLIRVFIILIIYGAVKKLNNPCNHTDICL